MRIGERIVDEIGSTDISLQELPADLPARLDLDFAFELAWRLERCLCPPNLRQSSGFSGIHSRPLLAKSSPQAGATLDSLSRDGNDVHTRGTITLDDIRRRCHYLLLAMMRYYREEGLSKNLGRSL